MDSAKLKSFIEQSWDDAIVPTLVEYIKIPNKSPHFDPDWQAHGHMDKAVTLLEGWARERIAGIDGATLEVVRLEGRTPVIFIEIPGKGVQSSVHALWPSRQAAGDDGLGRGAGAVDAGDQGRQALWPRRRR